MKQAQPGLAKVCEPAVRRNLRQAGKGLFALVALLLLASVALAQSGDGASALLSASYDLSWWTVDGGGYTFSEGDGYALGGTIGQPDAGVLSGGGYSLGSGFWGGGAAPIVIGEEYEIYLPLALRDFS